MPWKDKSKYETEEYCEYKRNYQKAWHQRHKTERNAKVYERKDKLREFYRQFKENSVCAQCGESHLATLHFHHRNSEEKDFNLAELIRKGYGIERIKREITKYIVLCTSCYVKYPYDNNPQHSNVPNSHTDQIGASKQAKYGGVFRPIPKEKGIKGAIGAESEAVIAAVLIQAGYTVLTPNGYMHRYDLVIEDANGELWKIQCKTAWLTSGGDTIDFSTASLLQAGQRGRKVSTRKTYKNDVHFFAVYSPDTRKVYLVPIEDTPNTVMRLRLTDTSKNGQAKGIRYAIDYEL